MATSHPIRLAARAIVLDEHDRVLLFRGELPDRAPWWFTPGGAVEAGESHVQALVRELAEEIGLRLRVEDVGPPVWTRDHLFMWHSVLERHLEEFYLVRAPGHVVDTSAHLEAESAVIREHRWWSLAHIRRSEEVFAPRRLGIELTRLLTDGPPPEPVLLGE
jgi:8-oxo-dGTP diphosphatase